MAQEHFVTVQIFNQTYRISSDQEDAQYVEEAAQYLDQKMQEAAGAAGSRGSLDIDILAAMNIAEEVLKERHKKEGLLNEADQRINRFTRLLEERDTPDSSPDEDAADSSTPRF